MHSRSKFKRLISANLAVLTLFCAFNSIVHAQSSTGKLVDPTAIKKLTIKVTVSKKSYKSVLYCLGKVPGTASKRETKLLFTPYTQIIRTAISRKDKKLPVLKAIAKAGTISCKGVKSPIASPTPVNETPINETPSPTATPALPKPTSTPAGSVANFDSSGDVTSAGKSLFQIPSQVSANITRGKAVSNSFCSGCHGERVGQNYPRIDAAIRRSPMLYDESQIPLQQRADLVAYLNRFRP